MVDRKFITWVVYVNRLRWEKGYLDNSSYLAFLRGASLGIDSSLAISLVADQLKAAGVQPKDGKLSQQCHRAYQFANVNPGYTGSAFNSLRSKLSYDLSKLERVARWCPQPNEGWRDALASISPARPDCETPETFLQQMFLPNEQIVVFADHRSRGDYLFKVPLLRERPRPMPVEITRSVNGAWFLIQPVDGKSHLNPRTGKMSRRSEESVVHWPYLLLESDAAAPDLWLRAVVQMPLPISAIYSSGRRSIHVLVRVDAANKAEWDRLRDDIVPVVVQLGADPQAVTAIRLSRLPNAWRDRCQQTLLYLDPAGSDTPLIERPLVEPPSAVWQRMAESMLTADEIDPESAKLFVVGANQYRDIPTIREALKKVSACECDLAHD